MKSPTMNQETIQAQRTIEQRMRDVQHFGEEGGVVPVIDVAATSTFLNPQDMERTFRGELQGCYLYSRHSNPSVNALSQKLAAMEGSEAALGVASGMAAVATAVEAICTANGKGPGGHIVCSRTVYGGTWALFANLLPRRGIEVTFVDPTKPEEFERAIRPSTRLVYTETVSNPLLTVCDIAAVAKIAHARGLPLVVDNTFTPMLVSPIALGADVVIHSCTKFISGSSDLIAGAVCASRDFINQLIDVNTGPVMLTGPVMDARVAHELYLRLDHLGVRLRAHSESSLALAKNLEQAGIRVLHPGLESHPQYGLYRSILNPGLGTGAMMTLDCGTSAKAMELAFHLQKEKFGLYAVSLGFSRTLMSCPSVSTSSEIPEADQKTMGLSPGLLRLSVGYLGDTGVLSQRFLDSWKAVGLG